MGYAILALAVVTLSAVFIKNQLRDKALAAAFGNHGSNAVEFKLRVAVKYKLPGGWSRKTLAGMEIAVRDNSIQIAQSSPALRGALGSHWLLDGPDTTIEVSDGPSPRFFKRDWILISGSHLDERVVLAVSSSKNASELWCALITSGARSNSDPPDLSFQGYGP
jgi:hypothetical protein